MKNISRQLLVVLLLSLLGLAQAMAADGDWARFRADAGYSGRATQKGKIDKPGVRWNYYLGGQHAEGDVWIGSLGEGSTDSIVTISGGKVVVKDANDQALWISPLISPSTILGAYDFDGDGAKELLVARYQAPAALYIFDALDGTRRWSFENFSNSAGSFAGYQVIVTDLDGDGLPDILGKPDESHSTYAFGFKTGFKADGAQNLLWSYAHTAYHYITPYVVGDLDGDEIPEVVFFEYQSMTILNGKTGEVEQRPTVFNSYSFGLMQIVKIGNDPQPKILAIGNSSYNASVVLYNPKTRTTEWAYQWNPAKDKALSYTQNSLIDLDADGVQELVVSVWNDTDDENLGMGTSSADFDGVNNPGRWTLLVFNALSGRLKASFPDALLRGILPASGTNPALLLAQATAQNEHQAADFGTISALRLTPDGLAEVSHTEHSALALASHLPRPDLNTMSDAVYALTTDANGDGSPEALFLKDGTGAGVADTIALLDLQSNPPVSRASRALTPGETWWPLADGILTHDEISTHLAVFRSSGYVELLNGNNLAEEVSLRAGSFSAAPLVADLDNDGKAEVVVTNSNGQVCVLDTKLADVTHEPTVRFCFQGHNGGQNLITVDTKGDGKRQILVVDMQDRNNPVLRLLGADGVALWSRTLTGYARGPHYYIPGRFHTAVNAADKGSDILVVGNDRSKPTDKAWRLEAISGTDGSRLWEIAPQQNVQMLTPPIVKDINGDTVDDVLWLTLGRNESYDGRNGALIDSMVIGGSFWARSGVLLDFDANGHDELLATYWDVQEGISLYDLLVAPPRWTVPINYQAETNTRWPGIIALAGGKYGFVKPSSLGAVSAFDSAGQLLWGPRYIRGGRVLASAEGAPTDMSGFVVGDVTGDGKEETLCGTADGYLVAQDATSGEKVFSINLTAAVSEPVLADIDRDGFLDILASTSDGKLQFISGTSLASASQARAVPLNEDLSLGDTAVTITKSEFGDALGGAWDLPTDAKGAFVTVVDENGNPLGSWTDLKTTKSLVVPGVYNLGKSYRVWVMSYGDAGNVGQVAQSELVTIVDETPPTIGEFSIASAYVTGETKTSFKLQTKDRTALASYVLSLKDGAGATVFSEDRPAHGTALTKSVGYDLRTSQGAIMPEGNYTAQMVVKDRADHKTSATLALHIVRSAPPRPLVVAPANGAHLATGIITVSGQGPLGGVIKVLVDGKPFCESAVVGSDLQFTCANTTALSNGWHVLWAVAKNEVGKEGELSDMVAFGIDSAAPAKPVITVPASGATLATTHPTFSGTAEAKSVVSIYEGTSSQDHPLCVTVANAAGEFACAATLEVTAGGHQAAARAVDEFGNASELSVAVSYVVTLATVVDGDSETETPDGDTADTVENETSVTASSGGGGCAANGAPADALALTVLGLSLLLFRRRRQAN